MNSEQAIIHPLPVDGKSVSEETRQLEVTVDGKRVVFHAEEEIVLHCGRASITLTKAGKILIKGEYVLSSSVGENRIIGGSVSIN